MIFIRNGQTEKHSIDREVFDLSTGSSALIVVIFDMQLINRRKGLDWLPSWRSLAITQFVIQ